LEETAYDNKNRRLEAHGFVDYYDALSIYATSGLGDRGAPADREQQTEEIPGEENPGNLPAVFADSLLGGAFLMKAFEQITDPAESDRFAQELTALGNRILSANLVNLGELEGIRPALEEMRDFLTIGLERLTGGKPDAAPDALRKNYIQTVFKIGFDQVARLRDEADRMVKTRGFNVSMLDETDQQFIEAVRRFKPLLAEEGHYRSFQSIADVDRARARLGEISRMIEVFMVAFPIVRESLRKTFNTATIQFAVSGKFEPIPVTIRDLEQLLSQGFRLPPIEIPNPMRPFAENWWRELTEELQPLAGKPIDRRFIASIELV
jgi:hypothetical protein